MFKPSRPCKRTRPCDRPRPIRAGGLLLASSLLSTSGVLPASGSLLALPGTARAQAAPAQPPQKPAQQPAHPAAANPDPAASADGTAVARPLPEIVPLMRQVELNERTAEAIEKDYTYHTASRLIEYDGHGAARKTETRDFDIFWQDGVQVRKLVAKDGKPLPPDELKKEDARIDEEVAKAKARREKADSQDKETDSAGHDEITLSRLLELGAFSNARRVQIAGRDTIAIDFTGDPKAKIRNRSEGAVREMAGTLWVDEQDKAIQHLEGRFVNPYKVAGGMVMNVSQGTSFKITNVRLNNEVWLPQSFEAHGHARVLLFLNLDGDISAHMSDYHKFRASSHILPGVEKVEPEAAAPAVPATQPSTPPR